MRLCDFCFKKRFSLISVHFDNVCKKCFKKNKRLQEQKKLEINLGSGAQIWETNEIPKQWIERHFNTKIKDNKIYFRAIDGNFVFIDTNNKIIIFEKEAIWLN